MTQINVDIAVQLWCPLEHTPYEGFCLGDFHNIWKRPAEPCKHSDQCSELKAVLESYDNENRSH